MLEYRRIVSWGSEVVHFLSKYRRIFIRGIIAGLLLVTMGCFFIAGFAIGTYELEKEYTREVASLNTVLSAIRSYYAEHGDYPREYEFYLSINTPGLVFAGMGPDYVIFYSGFVGAYAIRITFLEKGEVGLLRGTEGEMRNLTEAVED